MALSLKHHTQAAGTDAGTGEIHKAEWNESHDHTGTANRLYGFDGTGAATEVTVGTGLAFGSSALTLSVNLQGWSGVAVASYYTSAQADTAIAAYAQPLTANLTSWGAITRASSE